MAEGISNIRSVKGRAPGDAWDRDNPATTAEDGQLVTAQAAHPLDAEPAREELRKLLEWFYYEKDLQAANRLEMAIDADFYDGIQWDPNDAETLRERGQMPLVYNEIAPMVDWMIGTERRTRVDWKVLPRTEDDVQLADVKTKAMKYVSDVNRVAFARSKAFADAAKCGVGWLDDGVRDDPTKDILYSKTEDWRNVLWDSASYELDLSDARYIFRWRWVDEDIALMMFPDRADAIRRAVEDSLYRLGSSFDEDDTSWFSNTSEPLASRSGALYAQGSGLSADAKRRRVRLIECQYRKPVKVRVVADGPMRGALFDERDGALVSAVSASRSSIIDRVSMRVHVAVFTERDLLSMGPSIFRHNEFSLTPIWCYRRSRDRLPYGMIRRVRDIQQDLNKRASKALFLLNTNQVIADEGAVEDWDVAVDEASRPDGLVIKKQGKEFLIRRDTDAATGQMQMMTLDAQSIQKSAGVAQENLGRQTNAVSGEAIKARQLQGSVVTTEPFDNLRLATQVQGVKQLSLVEQWYTEAKVIRLAGERGALEWVRINEPEQQADGSVRYINDITASMADFIVSEADYAGTLRQVMFDSLVQIAQRLPPEVALRLLRMAYEFSDLPNKDAIADEIRQLTGERDPNKPMTPEEERAQAQQQQAQMEAMQMQREQAIATLEEQRAKTRELNARAAKLEAEATGGDPGMQGLTSQVRAATDGEIERLQQELQRVSTEAANRTMQINKEADTALETERIRAASAERVAEIRAASDQRLARLEQRLADMESKQKPATAGKE